MANTITAFLETLVAAAGDYNAAVVGQTAFLDGVYMDVQPEVARAGKTVEVYFPDFGAFSDIGSGDFADQNINPNFVSLAFNAHPAASFVLRDFEQFQTAVQIREKFLDPMYKRAAEYLNGIVAGLVTPTNFSVNTPIVGATPQEVTVANTLKAWNALANAKVPLASADDLSLFVHNDVFANMLGDNSWVQESLVGREIAQRARQQGALDSAFKFQPRWDQQSPKVSAAVTGTSVGVTNGSAAVTGTATSFSTQLAVGQYLIFANDATATPYRILSISSNTALTLATNYAGATNAATQATQQSYTCVAMHRYAIAVALRPLPPPDTNVVHYLPLLYRGIPLRLMFSYQHRNGGWLTSVDFGYAAAVIRPSFGVIITC